MSGDGDGRGQVRGRVEVTAGGGARVVFELPTSGPPAAGDAGMSPAAPAITHGRDYAGVRWGERTFQFSPRQRAVVAALLQAREQGHEWVGQDTLLELADSDGGRLRDLFRGHPAWGTLIVSAHQTGGPVGAFRAADPPAGGG